MMQHEALAVLNIVSVLRQLTYLDKLRCRSQLTRFSYILGHQMVELIGLDVCD